MTNSLSPSLSIAVLPLNNAVCKSKVFSVCLHGVACSRPITPTPRTVRRGKEGQTPREDLGCAKGPLSKHMAPHTSPVADESACETASASARSIQGGYVTVSVCVCVCVCVYVFVCVCIC